MWQDYVFAVGAFVFVIALVPAIRDKQKPALSTSLMTGATATVFACTYASLHFLFATTLQTVLAFLWFTLAYQRFMQGKRK